MLSSSHPLLPVNASQNFLFLQHRQIPYHGQIRAVRMYKSLLRSGRCPYKDVRHSEKVPARGVSNISGMHSREPHDCFFIKDPRQFCPVVTDHYTEFFIFNCMHSTKASIWLFCIYYNRIFLRKPDSVCFSRHIPVFPETKMLSGQIWWNPQQL